MKGQTPAELAKQLPGRPLHGINIRMYRLAMTAGRVAPSRQPWTAQDDTKLLSQYASGKPIRDIAEELGRAYHSTHNRLQTLRLRQKPEADRNDDKA